MLEYGFSLTRIIPMGKCGTVKNRILAFFMYCLLISTFVLLLGYVCNFVRGNGVGGTEQNIGSKPTPQACIDACVNKKKTDTEINGVTMTLSRKGSCYCERKMVKLKDSLFWKTCQLQKKGNPNRKFSGEFFTNVIDLKPQGQIWDI